MVLSDYQNLYRIQEKISDYTFVFDIDNTLISEDGNVDEDFFPLAQIMINQGLNLTFATGRSYEFCKDVVERVKPKLPIICFDGQVLCTSQRVLYKHVFQNISKAYLDELRKDFYIYFEDTYEIVTLESTGALIYSLEFGYPRKCIKIEPNMHVLNPLRIYLRKKQNSIACDNEKIRGLVCFDDVLIKKYQKEVWMMIYPRKTDKVNASLELCKSQGIDISTIIFFGDDYNDLKLMKECGISIAMGDSVNDILEISDIIIGTVAEKGVSSFLRKVLQIG